MLSASRREIASRLENFFLPDRLISASADSRAGRFAVICNSFFSRLSADEATAGAAKSVSIYRKQGATQVGVQNIAASRSSAGPQPGYRLLNLSIQPAGSDYSIKWGRLLMLMRYLELILQTPTKMTTSEPLCKRHMRTVSFHLQTI